MLMLFYYGDKLHTISVDFDSEDFSKVMDALQAKYGKCSIEESTVHNRMGASFQNETCSWKKPGQTLKAEKYSSDLKTSTVAFLTDASIAEFSKRSKSSAAANAKDL